MSDSVWLRDDIREPRRPLTRERIAAAAAGLLDAGGPEGLTMRRLAEQLGVTSTALYWHVKTRDDVLDLAVDQIFGEVAVPAASTDWRADVRALLRGWRAAMLDHPWAPALIGRPMLGPHVLTRTEFLQAALVRGGLAGLDLAVTTRLLANFVIGAALTEATWRGTTTTEDRAEARKRIAGYPTLRDSGHLDESRWPDDELFERGLTSILGE